MAQANISIDGAVGTAILKPTEFKTGSKGYRGQVKVETLRGRYQVQVQAILIGSKPQASK